LPGPMAAGDAPPGSPVAKKPVVAVRVLEALVLLAAGRPLLPENGPPPAAPLVPPMVPQPKKAQFTTVAPPKL